MSGAPAPDIPDPADGQAGSGLQGGSGFPGGSGFQAGPWPRELLADVLWWIAVTLALRSFFEPVMVSYYPWPAVAVALIPAATLNRVRLLGAAVVATGITIAAQGPSHSVWIWWLPLVLGLVLQLAASRGYQSRRRPGSASVSQPATT